MSFVKKLGRISVVCLVIFLFYKLIDDSKASDQILVSSSGLTIINAGQSYSWNIPNPKKIQHFLTMDFSIDSIPINESMIINHGYISRFSQNIFRVVLNSQIYLLIGADISEEELQSNLKKRVSYKSDYWILETNNSFLLSYLVPPNKAVLLLVNQKPTQLWREWSQKNQIPIIPVKKYDDASIKIIDGIITVPSIKN